MKKTIIFLSLFISFISFAQTDAEMKAYMEYLTPGPMHSHLAESVGNWDYTLKTWGDPAAQPTVDKGTSKGEMILGGRYFQMTHEGTAWGMPFSAIQLFGFDNAKQEFLGFWIDNMGTGFTCSSGKMDFNKPYLEMFGTFVDPLTKKDVKFRSVLKSTDIDHFSIQMHIEKDGKEMLFWETGYSRRK
ncbi:hypothetical protein MASR2M39_31090 [Ignavibacteriales bacterium]